MLTARTPVTWTWGKVIRQLGKLIQATWLNVLVYWSAWRFKRHRARMEHHRERMETIVQKADDLR